MADNKLESKLTLNSDDFKKGIADAKKSAKDFRQSSEKDFSAVAGSFVVAAGSMIATGVINFFQGLVGTIGDSVKEAVKAEGAIDSLSSSLKRAGLYSKSTVDELSNFADELEKTTLYTAEQALEVIKLQSELTVLDKDGLKKATTAAADLSAALSIDLESANQMIIKSVNGNTVAFSKMGIEIKKGKTDTERLNNTLIALSGMAGAAAEKTQNYAGAQNKLNDSTGNLQEELGNIIIKSPLVIAAFNSLAENVVALTGIVKSAGESFIDFQNYLIRNQEHIKNMGLAVGITAAAFGTWKIATIALSTSLATLASYAGMVATSIIAISEAVLAFVSAPVTLIVAALVAIAAGVYLLIENFDLVSAYFTKFQADMANGMSGLVRIFSDDWANALEKWANNTNKKADEVVEKINNMKFVQKEVPAPFWKQAPTPNFANTFTLKGITPEQGTSPLMDTGATQKTKQEEEQDRIRLARVKAAQAELQKQQKLHNDTMLNLDSEKNKNENIAYLDFENQKAIIALEKDKADMEKELVKDDAYFARLAEKNLQILDIDAQQKQFELDQQYNFDLQKAQQIIDADKREEELRKVKNEKIINDQKLLSKKSLDEEKAKIATLATLDKQRESDKKTTLSNLASLSTSSNKELASIGKVAASFQLGVDAVQAWGAAMSLGPIAGPIAAAAISAGFAIKIAELNGMQFANGGLVNGPGTSRSDSIPAALSNQEFVMQATAVSRYGVNMMNQINQGTFTGGSGDSAGVIAVLTRIEALMAAGHSININGREIIQVIRDEKDIGRTF